MKWLELSAISKLQMAVLRKLEVKLEVTFLLGLQIHQPTMTPMLTLNHPVFSKWAQPIDISDTRMMLLC